MKHEQKCCSFFWVEVLTASVQLHALIASATGTGETPDGAAVVRSECEVEI